MGSNLQKALFLLLFLLIAAISTLAAAFAYLISTWFTGILAFNLFAGALVQIVLSYSLARVVASAFLTHPKRWATIVSAALFIGLAALINLPRLHERWIVPPYPVRASTLSALEASTIPLDTVQPGSGIEDLQPLKPLLDGKRILALGEATHGTAEFFAMKHRLLEFAVLEMGFEHFGMETSPEAAALIQDYIDGGSANPASVLYWPWATEEVLAMLDWMRVYNTDPDTRRPLTFHGIDPRSGDRDRIMAQNVARILEEHGPQSKIVLWAHNAHISNAEGWMGRYLKQQFDGEAYLMGFEFNQGAFTSRMLTVQTYQVGPAPATYYAHALAQMDQPILFLDFKHMARHPELQAWLQAGQLSHQFQELHAVYRLLPAWHRLDISWLRLYDGVIFIEHSAPAIGLR